MRCLSGVVLAWPSSAISHKAIVSKQQLVHITAGMSRCIVWAGGCGLIEMSTMYLAVYCEERIKG